MKCDICRIGEFETMVYVKSNPNDVYAKNDDFEGWLVLCKNCLTVMKLITSKNSMKSWEGVKQTKRKRLVRSDEY